MTIQTATKNARKQRQQRVRETVRAARVAAEADRARKVEAAAEDIAPASQRHPVVSAGLVLREARLVPDGVTFRRASPLSAMSRSSITPPRERAADRLLRAWEDGGQGVGVGAVQYGERTSGEVTTGWISDGVIAKLAYQTRCRDEYAAAMVSLGSSAPIVRAVVLEGVSVDMWSLRNAGDCPNAQVARGYLLAGLDRLVDFYVARARAAGVERRERERELVA
jgi:hypothetical protein